LVASRGRIGSAQVGLMTVTIEEAKVVARTFALDTALPGTGYTTNKVDASSNFQIVHKRLPNQTNLMSVQTAGDLIEDFRPAFLILIGTAGGHSGRDGLNLGDIVVADYVDYSGYWKYKKGAVIERKMPHDHPSGHLIQNYAEPLRVSPKRWIDRIQIKRPGESIPKLFIGGLVSGNILLGDPKNKEQVRILNHFDKAYAFEMEGFGLSSAVFKARTSVYYNPQYLLVRGISDLVDRDAEGNQETRVAWTPYAVSAAASFAAVLLEDFFSVTTASQIGSGGSNADNG
jgi:nucleoside phosphorylase